MQTQASRRTHKINVHQDKIMNNRNWQKKSHPKLALAVSLALLALVTNQALAGDYIFSDLGTITGPYAGAGANGINNLGQVVGYGVSGNNFIPLLWNGNNATQLDNGPGGVGAVINSINDVGQSAGYNDMGNDTAYNAIRWDGTVGTQLGTVPGTFLTNGTGINNHGQVVGFISPDAVISSATRWDGTAMTDLGNLGGQTSVANGINDAGQAVGYSTTLGEDAKHATLWNGNSLTDLGTLGGTNSAANSINNAGQIVGNASITGDSAQHAALWNSINLAATDLGTLGGDSNAQAINNLGQIVGFSNLADGTQHATLWKDGSLFDLNNYLGSDLKASGWYLFQANGINDNGVIVGWAVNGLDSSLFGSFMLTPTPVPVPAALWLFGSGLAGLVGVMKRRQSAV
jgi:probable HAF family extracellular repeat protein